MQDDKKGRFNLIQESETDEAGNPAAVWWIRANQGHSIKVSMLLRGYKLIILTQL